MSNDPVPTMIDWHDNVAKDATIAALEAELAEVRDVLNAMTIARTVGSEIAVTLQSRLSTAITERDAAVEAEREATLKLIGDYITHLVNGRFPYSDQREEAARHIWRQIRARSIVANAGKSDAP